MLSDFGLKTRLRETGMLGWNRIGTCVCRDIYQGYAHMFIYFELWRISHVRQKVFLKKFNCVLPQKTTNSFLAISYLAGYCDSH